MRLPQRCHYYCSYDSIVFVYCSIHPSLHHPTTPSFFPHFPPILITYHSIPPTRLLYPISPLPLLSTHPTITPFHSLNLPPPLHPSHHHPHSGSHLVTVPPGPLLSDTLMTSPILVGEDGQVGGFERGRGLRVNRWIWKMFGCYGWFVVLWVVCGVMGGLWCYGWFVVLWVVCGVMGGLGGYGWFGVLWVVWGVMGGLGFYGWFGVLWVFWVVNGCFGVLWVVWGVMGVLGVLGG